MSIADELHTLATTLKAEGHRLADAAHHLWDRVRGDETALATEVTADAHHLTVTAGPVVAELKADAKSIGEDVAQEVKAIATEATTDVKAAVEEAEKPTPQA